MSSPVCQNSGATGSSLEEEDSGYHILVCSCVPHNFVDFYKAVIDAKEGAGHAHDRREGKL